MKSGNESAASGDQPAQSPDPRGVEAPEAPNRTPAAAHESVAIEQLVGELIMTKLVGPTLAPEEQQAIRDLHVGGVILFGPNVVDAPQLRQLTAALDVARAPQAARAGLPPRVLVSVDQEGGPIRNVPFAPPDQTQPQLASLQPPQVQEVARATGAALSELGLGLSLGPVADLAAGPNRTMAGRAFGEDPQPAAARVAASVRGLQAGGVAAAAKHFPGFGSSTANSDDGVAYVDRTAAELRSVDLVPFRAAIDAGAAAIMVSHGIHRSLGSTLPGTLDPAIAIKLLRDDLGFEGVAMTDSMNAVGFREAWGDTVPRSCPVALAAGIDLLLLTGSMETARLCRERIIEAVRTGELPEARVREAAGRVLALHERYAGS